MFVRFDAEFDSQEQLDAGCDSKEQPDAGVPHTRDLLILLLKIGISIPYFLCNIFMHTFLRMMTFMAAHYNMVHLLNQTCQWLFSLILQTGHYIVPHLSSNRKRGKFQAMLELNLVEPSTSLVGACLACEEA